MKMLNQDQENGNEKIIKTTSIFDAIKTVTYNNMVDTIPKQLEEEFKKCETIQIEDMDYLLSVLEMADGELDKVNSRLNQRIESFESDPEIKTLREGAKALKKTSNALSNLYKEQAVKLYKQTGKENKIVHTRAKIIEKTVVSFDEMDAIKFAVKQFTENENRNFLSPNMKMIESHAKAVLKTDPLPFVKVEKVPQAQITKKPVENKEE